MEIRAHDLRDDLLRDWYSESKTISRTSEGSLGISGVAEDWARRAREPNFSSRSVAVERKIRDVRQGTDVLFGAYTG